MKKMKKKRVAKFEAHCVKILSPFVRKLINGEECDFFNLSRAIDGIIYQHVGDEDWFLNVTEENRKDRIAYLENFISEFSEIDWESKKDAIKNLDDECEINEFSILCNYLIGVPFGVIVKENPNFFYYKEPKTEVKGPENDPNSGPEKPNFDA